VKVGIGFEESGKTRDAFLSRGHLAISCDLQPSRRPGPHAQMDIFKFLERVTYLDLLILHPNCTKLTVSGNRWYGAGKPLHHERLEAIKFVESVWEVAKGKAKRVALENPIGVLSTQSVLGKPSQIIQPWQYGHGETKATCLWLHNLPLLIPTNIVEGREQRVWKMPPSETRKRDRSETFDGWAEAFADQWGIF
jgi:hypothetical protein